MGVTAGERLNLNVEEAVPPADRLTELGLKETLIPAGYPEALRFTVELKP